MRVTTGSQERYGRPKIGCLNSPSRVSQNRAAVHGTALWRAVTIQRRSPRNTLAVRAVRNLTAIEL